MSGSQTQPTTRPNCCEKTQLFFTQTIPDWFKKTADVNQDGVVNFADAQGLYYKSRALSANFLRFIVDNQDFLMPLVGEQGSTVVALISGLELVDEFFFKADNVIHQIGITQATFNELNSGIEDINADGEISILERFEGFAKREELIKQVLEELVQAANTANLNDQLNIPVEDINQKIADFSQALNVIKNLRAAVTEPESDEPRFNATVLMPN